MNMPRLAIEARREAEELHPDGDKHAIRREARILFLEKVRSVASMMPSNSTSVMNTSAKRLPVSSRL